MNRFKNILVAVDLGSEGELISEGIAEPVATAVADAVDLAKQNSASVTFLNVLEVSAYAEALLAEGRESEMINKAETALDHLVDEACKESISACRKVVFGKSWVEIIRQVVIGNHDLVIAGTHGRGRVSSAMFGSTGMKLLRKCPCPVWLTKPSKHELIQSVLVANDLSPVSDLAVELGASMAALEKADLHILHALDLGLGRPEWDSYGIRTREKAEASKRLEAQVEQLSELKLAKPPEIHLLVDRPARAILHCIEKYDIELLVMGTVARGGLPGVMMGNTAERILPRIPCSVLAVKPDDFKCPIILD